MRQVPYWALLVSVFVAFLICVYALLYDEPETKSQPIKNTYYPFTVEVEIWDTGASPWDERDRPLP